MNITYVLRSKPMADNKQRGGGEEEKSITEDLLTDIISRLSVKDLMRFTCVSKSWRSLICTESYFHRLQVQRTASLDRPFMFIESKRLKTGSRGSRWVYNNYWINSESLEGHRINIGEINYPFGLRERPHRCVKVMGSCHGLILLQHQRNLKMAVSNPTAKKHVMVPPNPAGDANVVFCGFGYDRVHDCYKVVAKVKQIDRTLDLVVYDLNKGTWVPLQFGTWWRSKCDELHINSQQLDRYSVECVDGGVYWCIYVNEYPKEMVTMVCFLLAEEEFYIVKPPGLGEVKYSPNMTVLDERLGMVCQGLNKRHEVWILDTDYDGGGTRQWRWTKLLSISDPSAMLRPFFAHLDVLIPVCFSACRNKILFVVDRGQFFWYDMRTKKFRWLRNPINNFMYRGTSYARSCVPRLSGFKSLLLFTQHFG